MDPWFWIAVAAMVVGSVGIFLVTRSAMALLITLAVFAAVIVLVGLLLELVTGSAAAMR